jgi:putative endonuclease
MVFCFMRVYILKSTKTGRYYCGHTADLENRLLLHNLGKNKSTAHGIPWDLVWTMQQADRSDAMRLENQIKSRGISRFLSDIPTIR